MYEVKNLTSNDNNKHQRGEGGMLDRLLVA